MISKALNFSDRFSGCAKLAKRMLSGQKTHFCVYQFLTAMEGASAEELDEFLVRYNMNGIELNEEGFQKLSEEISLDSVETKLEMPWGKENVTAALRRSAHGRIGGVARSAQEPGARTAS